MAQVRFMKIACLLSNQKAALALHLNHHIRTGEAPHKGLGTTISPTTLAEWNLLLGEVDKSVLKDELSTIEFDIAVFADDSNKRGEDQSHGGSPLTWSKKHSCLVGYVLSQHLGCKW